MDSMTLEEARDRLSAHFDDFWEDDELVRYYLNDAIEIMFSVLDYAELLTNKFGSLEEALEAEKVTHCKECVYWHSDKQYCERPCMGKMFCPPAYYCGSGMTREWVESIADKFNNIGTVNPISPVGLRAALKLYDDTMDKEVLANESLESV